MEGVVWCLIFIHMHCLYQTYLTLFTPLSCIIAYGPKDEAQDPELSEDAHFITRVMLPDETGQETREAVYVGVADGVGSWREYGVDPREFSHSLMQECENILREANTKNAKKVQKGDEKFCRQIAPAEVMAQAYERVKADNIIGSSTACVAMFDGIRHQLHFSNLGDSGIIVLRHIDSTIAGTLKRDKSKPRTERTSDLRIAFVSQQQLRSFNHPYQLGWTGEEIHDGENTSFKNASESCTTSIHIRRGDIIIMATDGLFDNVELEDIAAMALEWEEKSGFIRDGDIAERESRWEKGGSMTKKSAEVVSDLADALVQRARENSLDKMTDSPFAILAKENDVMWSGGTYIYIYILCTRRTNFVNIICIMFYYYCCNEHNRLHLFHRPLSIIRQCTFVSHHRHARRLYRHCNACCWCTCIIENDKLLVLGQRRRQTYQHIFLS